MSGDEIAAIAAALVILEEREPRREQPPPLWTIAGRLNLPLERLRALRRARRV